MSVDQADAGAEQAVALDHPKDLLVGRRDRPRKPAEVAKDARAVAKAAERDLAQDVRVHQNRSRCDQSGQPLVAAAEMVNPDYGVGEDQSSRRCGGVTSLGPQPLTRASRSAASRSISALSASRTSGDFSLMPV